MLSSCLLNLGLGGLSTQYLWKASCSSRCRVCRLWRLERGAGCGVGGVQRQSMQGGGGLRQAVTESGTGSGSGGAQHGGRGLACHLHDLSGIHCVPQLPAAMHAEEGWASMGQRPSIAYVADMKPFVPYEVLQHEPAPAPMAGLTTHPLVCATCLPALTLLRRFLLATKEGCSSAAGTTHVSSYSHCALALWKSAACTRSSSCSSAACFSARACGARQCGAQETRNPWKYTTP